MSGDDRVGLIRAPVEQRDLDHAVLSPDTVHDDAVADQDWRPRHRRAGFVDDRNDGVEDPAARRALDEMGDYIFVAIAVEVALSQPVLEGEDAGRQAAVDHRGPAALEPYRAVVHLDGEILEVLPVDGVGLRRRFVRRALARRGRRGRRFRLGRGRRRGRGRGGGASRGRSSRLRPSVRSRPSWVVSAGRELAPPHPATDTVITARIVSPQAVRPLGLNRGHCIAVRSRGPGISWRALIRPGRGRCALGPAGSRPLHAPGSTRQRGRGTRSRTAGARRRRDSRTRRVWPASRPG